ncbi:hypothetical protein MSG28_001859 [Choristoneura fumiferana]|uniref:Uncharacterized protein n=1 Tax=Choristoneura fumiferana TaxID=7141 RepID=A0ACC0KWG3_CHOFU|nr:hypothetical protein MSG28_001859 [Choristoneura fumiferana]
MWVFLLSTVIILCVIHVLFNYNSFARLMRKIQGPDDELMDLARGFAKKFPNIHRFWCFPVAVVVIYNPEDIEIIVLNTMQTALLNKPELLYELKLRAVQFPSSATADDLRQLLNPLLEQPCCIETSPYTLEQDMEEVTKCLTMVSSRLLLSSTTNIHNDHEKWQTRRKILTPTFHFNILRQFSKILQENAQRLLDTLEATAERPIDVVPIISEFTLSSICETAMGTQLNKNDTEAGKTYKEAIYKIGSIVTYRFTRIYLFMDSIFNLTQMGSAQKKVLEIIRKFTTKVIRERKELLRNTDLTNIGEHNDANEDIFMKKSKKVAMLDLLISAEKEGLIDQAGIQEEVDTFMFEDKAAKEINELIGDPNRPIEMEDLRNMRYLECCIKESLRMYPPVPFIGRSLTEDVTLSNYHVPAGVQCHISIYDLHHREDLFPNPSVFDPDRFLPENCIGRHPYSYIPFSAGPRNCIGQKFAMLEMKLVLAEVLRKFELQPVTRPEDLKFVADLVLRNKDPVYVTFAKRNKTL